MNQWQTIGINSATVAVVELPDPCHKHAVGEGLELVHPKQKWLVVYPRA